MILKLIKNPISTGIYFRRKKIVDSDTVLGTKFSPNLETNFTFKRTLYKGTHIRSTGKKSLKYVWKHFLSNNKTKRKTDACS